MTGFLLQFKLCLRFRLDFDRIVCSLRISLSGIKFNIHKKKSVKMKKLIYFCDIDSDKDNLFVVNILYCVSYRDFNISRVDAWVGMGL